MAEAARVPVWVRYGARATLVLVLLALLAAVVLGVHVRSDAAVDASGGGRTAFVGALVALLASLVGLLVLAGLSRSFRRAGAAAEQRYRDLFDEAPVGMALVSLARPTPGRFVDVNRELCAMTGHSREELLATDIVSLAHPEDRAAIRGNLEQSQTGRVAGGSAERRWTGADGSTLWVRVSVQVLHETGPSAAAPGRLLVHAVDIGAQKEAEDALRRQALHDPLTDLPNRVLLNEHLGQALARARRRRTGVSVLYLDVDDFKQVNDGYGHSAGDEVLRSIADRLRTCLRESDTAARLGGDEFLVVSEDMTGERDVAALADRVLAALSEPVDLAGTGPVSVHVSIGAVLDVGGRCDPEELTVHADEAMYAAKRAGKNRRVVVTTGAARTMETDG